MTHSASLLNYYATPGRMTDPGAHQDLLTGLRRDIPSLCRVVQNNLLHIFWAERYGRSLSEDEKRRLKEAASPKAGAKPGLITVTPPLVAPARKAEAPGAASPALPGPAPLRPT